MAFGNVIITPSKFSKKLFISHGICTVCYTYDMIACMYIVNRVKLFLFPRKKVFKEKNQNWKRKIKNKVYFSRTSDETTAYI